MERFRGQNDDVVSADTIARLFTHTRHMDTRPASNKFGREKAVRLCLRTPIRIGCWSGTNSHHSFRVWWDRMNPVVDIVPSPGDFCIGSHFHSVLILGLADQYEQIS